MHISFEGKLSLWVAAFTSLGAGIVILVPEWTLVGWGMIAVALALGLFLIWHHICGWLCLVWQKGSRGKMMALGAAIILGTGVLGLVSAHFWPRSGVYVKFTFPGAPELMKGRPIIMESVFSNKSGEDAEMAELVIMAVETTAPVYSSYKAMNWCTDGILPLTRAVMRGDSAIEAKSMNLNGSFVRLLRPDTSDQQMQDFMVERAKSAHKTGSFAVPAIDWSTFNAVVFCPSVLKKSVDQKDTIYMCPGMLIYYFPWRELNDVTAALPKGGSLSFMTDGPPFGTPRPTQGWFYWFMGAAFNLNDATPPRAARDLSHCTKAPVP
jgi:hypothetical protein